MLCSLGAQEGEAVAHEGIGVTDHVTPQRGGADDRLVHGGEGLHDQRSPVADVFEAQEDLVPVDVRRSWRAPVRF